MSDRTDFLLSALRVVSIRARLLESEINLIGVSLKAGSITPEVAIAWATECGGPNILGFMPDKVSQSATVSGAVA